MEPCQAKWRDHADSAAIGHPSALSQADKLFLMLVRLQLNPKEQGLANYFEISASTVSRVFIKF